MQLDDDEACFKKLLLVDHRYGRRHCDLLSLDLDLNLLLSGLGRDVVNGFQVTLKAGLPGRPVTTKLATVRLFTWKRQKLFNFLIG